VLWAAMFEGRATPSVKSWNPTGETSRNCDPIQVAHSASVNPLCWPSCGGSTGSKSPTAGASDSSGFSAIAKQAKGQTVRWWLYGGDDKINAY